MHFRQKKADWDLRVCRRAARCGKRPVKMPVSPKTNKKGCFFCSLYFININNYYIILYCGYHKILRFGAGIVYDKNKILYISDPDPQFFDLILQL